MTKILSAVLLLLQFCSAYAVTETPPAPEGVSSLGTIIFVVLFFGFCFGFIWMVWKSDKKQKQEPEKQ